MYPEAADNPADTDHYMAAGTDCTVPAADIDIDFD